MLTVRFEWEIAESCLLHSQAYRTQHRRRRPTLFLERRLCIRFDITDVSMRFGFDELNECFVQIVEMSITLVNRPFKTAVIDRDGISSRSIDVVCARMRSDSEWTYR